MPSTTAAARNLHLPLRLRLHRPGFVAPAAARTLSLAAMPPHDRVALRLRVRKPQPCVPAPRPRRAARATASVPQPASAPQPAPAEPADAAWTRIAVPDGLLRLALTLHSGQVFRWVRTGRFADARARTGESDEWAGVVGQHAFLLRQAADDAADGGTSSTDDDDDDDNNNNNNEVKNDVTPQRVAAADPVWFRCLNAPGSPDAEAALRDFLQADTDFGAQMARFAAADARFAAVAPHLAGMRLLRQPVTECVFAFICSSNNHIKRISTMVSHLATAHGAPLATVRRAHAPPAALHAFPSAETLAESATESDLRAAGFGYRARFVVDTAVQLVDTARAEKQASVTDLLHMWRSDADSTARAARAARLTALPGVGRKVAGCVLLMSLDDRGEVPVDTHVWRIARRYLPALDGKTLTPRVYDAVGDFFRARFGADAAGVAHNVLFIAELPEFRRLLPARVVRVVQGVDAVAPDEHDGSAEHAVGKKKDGEKEKKTKKKKKKASATSQTTLDLKKRKRAVVSKGVSKSGTQGAKKRARKPDSATDASEKKRQRPARARSAGTAEG